MSLITSPTVRSVGAVASSASGGVTIDQPATVAINDILVIVISTANGVFTTWPPTGWEEVPTPPTGFGTAGAAGGLRLFLAWKRATSTTGNAVTTGNPGASNNYTLGRMIGYQDVSTRGNPWETSATSNITTATSSWTFGTINVLNAKRRIVTYVSTDADTSTGIVATTISGVTPTSVDITDTVTSGAGGGIFAHSGIKNAPGTTSASGLFVTGTFPNLIPTNTTSCNWIGALRPTEAVSRSIVF